MGLLVRMRIDIIILIVINVESTHTTLQSGRPSVISNILQYQNASLKWKTYLKKHTVFLFVVEIA
jgi:hypothetical protein